MSEKKIGNLSIRLDKDLLNDYKDLCEKNGYDMSKRLRLFIEAEVQHSKIGENIIDKIKG
jgi:antitoxin component of RelBE/YafQ-DinJ toxin-antitoxin module